MIFAILAGMTWTACQQNLVESSGYDSPLSFPTKLSADFPYDVDSLDKALLEEEGNFAGVQRLFEILSWQAFIGLNWPYKEGVAQPSITSAGDPLWTSWEESFEVFKTDGSAPTPWGEKYDVPASLEGASGAADCAHILYRTNKFSHITSPDIADEIDQAFSTTIWDQNGNLVRYEVRMNEKEYDYIVDNQLYNYDGQIEFFKKNGSPQLNFPEGSRDKEGAIEVKLAWKIIPEGDVFANRYYTKEVCVMDTTKTFTKQRVGLIGMHIALKTKSSPQWIWATFEHVDNLEVNELEEYNGKQLTPSFYDPECPICPVNVVPNQTAFENYSVATNGHVTTNSFTSSNYNQNTKDGKIRNQLKRTIPISMATQALNKEVQALLADAESPFQYYQLIGTQWPTQPNKAPATVYASDTTTTRPLPEAVTNKAGGMPTPVYLTNMVMETYFQGATDGSAATYNFLIANAPAYLQIENFPKNTVYSGKTIFSTESCIGCHSSSSIAIGYTTKDGKKEPVFAKREDYNSQTIGDFSWLPQLKAHFLEE